MKRAWDGMKRMITDTLFVGAAGRYDPEWGLYEHVLRWREWTNANLHGRHPRLRCSQSVPPFSPLVTPY